MDELFVLSTEQKLGVNEQERAKEIIAQLTTAYGDLGIRINEATGEITGIRMGAQLKLDAVQKESAMRELREAETLYKDTA